jgi:quercetin dioxygenase-like cupin family protein
MTDLPRLHPAAAARVLHVLGDAVAISGPVAGSDLWMAEVTVPPGSGTPPHRHASPETFRVIEGQAVFTVETAEGLAEVAAGPGDHLHVPAMAAHAYRNAGAGPLRVLVVLDASMIAFFEAAAAPEPLRGPPSPETVARVMAAAEAHGIRILAAA